MLITSTELLRRKKISEKLMGIVRSPETRKKMGEKSWIKGTHNQTNNALESWRKNGGKVTVVYGRTPWNKGKQHSEETCRKLSIARKNIPIRNWKGGVTPENMKIRTSLEMKIWREAVFKRDDFTCVWCKKRGGRLNADHIKPFSLFHELRFAIDNGRTLCVDCHRKTDTYGRKLKFI